MIGIEQLTPELITELDVFIDRYNKDTLVFVDMPPCAYIWETYVSAEERGNLLVCVVRDDNTNHVLGLMLYFVAEHLHHRGLVIGECDTFIVASSARGQGLGKLMLHFAEQHLKECGVSIIMNHHRTCFDVAPVFTASGFTMWEHGYMKRIN